MNQLVNLPRRARWAVPAGTLGIAGGVLAGSVISVAQAAPQLASRTPAQLVAALTAKTAMVPLSGTIAETTSLGLPALPSAGDPASLPSLLSGSHTVKVWYSDPAHYRLAVPQSLSESDLVRNGSSAWLWDSTNNTVTHLAVPANAQAPSLPAGPPTPQQAARAALALAGPTTAISADSNVTVAGQAAYQLVLAPKNSASLVGQVRIAIDARHDVPLRVQLFGRGAASPAIQIGFTSLSFARPPEADYAFSPPAGAVVTQASPGSTAAGRSAASKPAGSALSSGLSVIGQGWLTVASLPPSVLASLTGTARSGSPGSLPFSHSSSSTAPAPGGAGIPALGGDLGGILGALVNSAKHVSGPWGSGRLLRTSLLSVLITSDGRVLIGAVTPDVLYRDVSQAGRAPAAFKHDAASRADPK